MLYAFFWVIPRRLNFICRRFGTLCSVFIDEYVFLHTYPPMKMEQTECSETSAYKIQTPGNYPEESIQHSEHGESLKSINFVHLLACSLELSMQVEQCKNLHTTNILIIYRAFFVIFTIINKCTIIITEVYITSVSLYNI